MTLHRFAKLRISDPLWICEIVPPLLKELHNSREKMFLLTACDITLIGFDMLVFTLKRRILFEIFHSFINCINRLTCSQNCIIFLYFISPTKHRQLPFFCCHVGDFCQKMHKLFLFFDMRLQTEVSEFSNAFVCLILVNFFEWEKYWFYITKSVIAILQVQNGVARQYYSSILILLGVRLE